MTIVFEVILFVSTHTRPKGSDPWGRWEPFVTFRDFYEAREWAYRSQYINWTIRERAL